MGHYSPAFATLLRELGHEVILPNPPTKETLSLGTLYGPEFACLPLKICLGSYVESLERGAEVIVTSGGVGPCRAGLYGTVQREILKSLGYRFEMIVLEPPRRHPLELLKALHRLDAFRRAPWQLVNTAFKTWEMIKALDRLERELHRIRPREAEKGSAEAVYKRGCRAIGAQDTVAGIRKAAEEALADMRRVPLDPSCDPIKIGIVGEIYVLLEPAANLKIEKTLGELGAEVDRSIFLTGWTRENVVREGDNQTAREAAYPYLCEMIGGHGQDTVGHTVMYARQGYDGVIQLAPFTCIPEIVAKGVLPSVSRDLDIPIISFFLDEQTGEAGFRTRLEAFVDLLVRRREQRRLAG
jgi:predicted nucleotide-binding protein (sugar kinase/HSP70/actin superfamily)